MINNSQDQHPKPLLMIPVRRCGSHALRLRLNLSPDFYSPYPLHIVDFMPLVKLYGDLSEDNNYFQLVVDVVGLQNATMVKWDQVALDPITIYKAIKDRPRSIHSVVWEMLFQAGKQHNAKVIMDKSLDSVYYSEELISLFDDMLFLNVVRDPRAQVSSINNAIIHDFDTIPNTMTWVKAHKAAMQLANKYPDRVLTVRFEDFVANQEQVIREICNFIGIEFLDSMLDVSGSKEAQKISGSSALWESNAYAPIQANVEKFKKYLSLQDIKTIETLTSEYMDYYGYEKMTDANAKISNNIIAAAEDRSEVNKKLAWETLKQDDPHDYMLRQFRINYIDMVKRRLQN
jgi:hypothetical protein